MSPLNLLSPDVACQPSGLFLFFKILRTTMRFLVAADEPASMRGIFVLGIGLVIAYWLDQSHYGGMYSRAAADMLHQITASFR
jgi:hypothetical protein